jgi:hypothetical protein
MTTTEDVCLTNRNSTNLTQTLQVTKTKEKYTALSKSPQKRFIALVPMMTSPTVDQYQDFRPETKLCATTFIKGTTLPDLRSCVFQQSTHIHVIEAVIVINSSIG